MRSTVFVSPPRQERGNGKKTPAPGSEALPDDAKGQVRRTMATFPVKLHLDDSPWGVGTSKGEGKLELPGYWFPSWSLGTSQSFGIDAPARAWEPANIAVFYPGFFLCALRVSAVHRDFVSAALSAPLGGVRRLEQSSAQFGHFGPLPLHQGDVSGDILALEPFHQV